MPRQKSPIEKAAGQLVLAVQKEWVEELGTDEAQQSFEVMSSAHRLLQASKPATLIALLGGKSIAEYLGEQWVHLHPDVLPAIDVLRVGFPRFPGHIE